MNPRVLVPIAGAFLLFSCRIEEVLDVDPVSSVELSAPYPAISPGEVHQLRATLRDIDGNDLGPRSVRWRSLDPSFVTVDDGGRATGVAVGVARLVATSEGRADTIQLPVKATWARVWAGYRLVCAERIGGGTYCWGDAPGDGTAETRFAPVALSGVPVLRSIQRQSVNVTCGLTPAGAYYCWDVEQYLPSEYGNGTDSTHGLTPRQGASGLLLRSFGSEYSGTCGVGLTGIGWCWGSVYYGVDTVSSFNYRDAPDTVLGGITWRTLQAGEFGTCGLDVAGTPYCFGGAYPLLGQGATAVKRKLPTAVVGGHTFDSLYVNYRQACALKGNGEAWCWGEGSLGDGGGYHTSGTPVLVLGGHHFRALRSGFGATWCGLEVDGTIWCWGSAPERIETALPFADIASTGTTTCGLTAGGGLYCKGNALLGNGERGPSDDFVRVMDVE